jgi:hypothetical protein
MKWLAVRAFRQAHGSRGEADYLRTLLENGARVEPYGALQAANPAELKQTLSSRHYVQASSSSSTTALPRCSKR